MKLFDILVESFQLNKKKKLIALMGPAGVGKSTVVNLLKYKGIKHSTPDDIMELLVKQKYVKDDIKDFKSAIEKHGDEIFNLRSRAIDLATKRLNIWKELGHDIVIEGSGNYPDWYLNNIFIPFKDLDYDIMIVMIYAPFEVAVKRDISRGIAGGRTIGSKLISDIFEKFIDSYKDFKNIALDKGYDFLSIKTYKPEDLDSVVNLELKSPKEKYILDNSFDLEEGLKKITTFLGNK